MKFLGYLLAFLFTSNVFGFEITGRAEGFEGKFIRLYKIKDLISFEEEKSDVFRILDDGTFKLNGVANGPVLLKLSIENISGEFVLVGNANVALNVLFDPVENENRVFDKTFSFEIVDHSDDGVNELIWSYQNELAAFVEKNQAKFVSKRILPEVKKFQIAMKSLFANEDNPYFERYLDYSLVGLEDAVLGSEATLYNEYLADKPIRFNNLGYMEFFRQFYQERFFLISTGVEGFQFMSALTGTQDYNTLLEIVKNQPYIFSDTIAQLFIIYGIQEVYGKEGFEKDKLNSMLEILAEKSICDQNKKIAQNVRSKLFYLSKGVQAPDYSLMDAEGKVHHLPEPGKKSVLLFFWSARSPYSLKDLTLIDEFYQNYDHAIHFIGVNTDLDRSAGLKYIEKNKPSWEALFMDKQNDVVDKYRVRSTPFYVLLDKENIILKYPASSPAENLELELSRLTPED